MSNSEEKRLLASIHDVGPGFETAIDQLAELFESILGGPLFAMLVVPDHWGCHPLRPNASYRTKLRCWSDRGVEMFVHGWLHRDERAHRGTAAIKARHMTAGEGEFLGLTVREAERRMRDGKALIEDITGREAAGFVAPAWLYGAGAREALASCGFALAEDHLRVWRPTHGKVLTRGPVITWASRSAARTASSIAFASLARTALEPLRTVRVGVHPGDVTKPALLRSIETTLRRFTRSRSAGRYAELLEN